MLTKTTLAIPIFLSPVILFAMLLETSMNGAYPSEADSLGIPLFGYLIFFFPVSLYLLSKVRRGPLHRPKMLLWNPERHVFSAVSLILTIYPLGLFWLGFLSVGIASHSFGSILGSTLLLACVIFARTFAIQSIAISGDDALEQPAVTSKS